MVGSSRSSASQTQHRSGSRSGPRLTAAPAHLGAPLHPREGRRAPGTRSTAAGHRQRPEPAAAGLRSSPRWHRRDGRPQPRVRRTPPARDPRRQFTCGQKRQRGGREEKGGRVTAFALSPAVSQLRIRQADTSQVCVGQAPAKRGHGAATAGRWANKHLGAAAAAQRCEDSAHAQTARSDAAGPSPHAAGSPRRPPRAPRLPAPRPPAAAPRGPPRFPSAAAAPPRADSDARGSGALRRGTTARRSAPHGAVRTTPRSRPLLSAPAALAARRSSGARGAGKLTALRGHRLNFQQRPGSAAPIASRLGARLPLPGGCGAGGYKSTSPAPRGSLRPAEGQRRGAPR